MCVFQDNNCENTFAYMADLGSFSMVVYSWQSSRAWRVTHHYFHSDPMAGDYNVSGLNFQWTDGLFGLALSGETRGYRTLYFHPFSSYSEFAVSTRVLQNETLWTKSPETTYHLFKHLGYRGPHSQSCASFLDEKTGVLFYTQVQYYRTWKAWAARQVTQTLHLLHLATSFSNPCHSSFYNPSVALPTSQLILQPLRHFTHLTAHSPTLMSLHLCHSHFNYITWWAALGWDRAVWSPLKELQGNIMRVMF